MDVVEKWNEVEFKNLESSKWPFVKACPHDNKRIYFKSHNEAVLFEFEVLDFNSASCDTESVWDCPELEVTILFKGSVYFDGLRHLYTNPYLYYQSSQDLINIFTALKELEMVFLAKTISSDSNAN